MANELTMEQIQRLSIAPQLELTREKVLNAKSASDPRGFYAKLCDLALEGLAAREKAEMARERIAELEAENAALNSKLLHEISAKETLQQENITLKSRKGVADKIALQQGLFLTGLNYVGPLTLEAGYAYRQTMMELVSEKPLRQLEEWEKLEEFGHADELHKDLTALAGLLEVDGHTYEGEDAIGVVICAKVRALEAEVKRLTKLGDAMADASKSNDVMAYRNAHLAWAAWRNR